MISGFHKLSISERIKQLPLHCNSESLLADWIIQHPQAAEILNQLSENTIAHFGLPLGIAPNVTINGSNYFLPLVTEESSVVAAIAKAAKFWYMHGGFSSRIVDTVKKGQVHFFWYGDVLDLLNEQKAIIKAIEKTIDPIVSKMKQRGGGITEIRFINRSDELPHYFQIDFSFKTADAMGANFINTVLEQVAKTLNSHIKTSKHLDEKLLEINMAILSNYTPDCRVIASCSCSVFELNQYGETLSVGNLSDKLIKAFAIANKDISRAVTHNKGIFNGIDAVALATGNDWRAIEASGHAWASASGNYKALSRAFIQNQQLIFELEIPFAVGTVGGVANLHPLAKLALEILQNPSAEQLMQIIAVSGLAANFSAVLSLTTTGIQKGHMKMHLSNILNALEATNEQKNAAVSYFNDKTVSHSAVEAFLNHNYE